MTYVLGVLVVTFGLYMLIRNVDVWRERSRVLWLVHEHAQEDIRAGRRWEWRYDAYYEVSYWDMLFSVRRPWDFFDGHPCIRP